METNGDKKVYVGMSGGVDSSVSAALLKRQGFKVTGVFIKIWHPEISNCDWKEEMRDAMRVCAHLKIPFKMIDLSDVYIEEVIKYMISEYENGRTPNPDVMCNKYIKFGAFYKWAIGKEKADFVATGHYAFVKHKRYRQLQIPTLFMRKIFGINSPILESKRKLNKKLMRKGLDKNKDQTYFLWGINPSYLNKTIFPIGNYTKKNVRRVAKLYRIPTANKQDSQGLCFIGDVNIKNFLKKEINVKKGSVIEVESDKKIGEHDGALLYTIGERHGFKIENNNNHQEPYYVKSKDTKKNILYVSKNKESDKEKNVYLLNKINVFSNDVFNPNNLKAKIRYRGIDHDIKEIKKIDNKNLEVVFENLKEKVASGQSVVFYKNDYCLGGGIVK